MDPEIFSTLTNVAYLLGGFFDFAIFLALMIIALGRIRPVEPGLGYAIAGLAATRFLCVCGSRSFSSVFEQTAFDGSAAIPAALVLFSFVTPLLTLALWGAVLFALVRLAGRVSR